MTKLSEIVGKPISGEWGVDDEDGIGIPVLRTTNFTNEGIINYSNVVTRIITKKGIEENKKEIAKKLFESGQTKKFISSITGLSLDELENILK